MQAAMWSPGWINRYWLRVRVNDRQMVSYMSNDKLDELVDALKAQAK